MGLRRGEILRSVGGSVVRRARGVIFPLRVSRIGCQRLGVDLGDERFSAHTFELEMVAQTFAFLGPIELPGRLGGLYGIVSSGTLANGEGSPKNCGAAALRGRAAFKFEGIAVFCRLEGDSYEPFIPED